MDFESLKKFWNKLGITLPEVVVAAIVVFVFGLILLSFTFILPILAVVAAFLLIAVVVYIIYKLLGGS